VLEASDRIGGVAGSERHEGVLLERGPDSLVTHKPAGVELCRRLGLGDSLVRLEPGNAEVLHRGRLVPVPAGFALLAPSRRLPLAASRLLGWRGALRALGESRRPAAAPPADGDESVAAFVRRRFGDELLERVVEPIVGAIYMADVERLSLAATFPRFLALEREHGSVTRGLREARAARAAAGSVTPAVATLAGGLGGLVEALAAGQPGDGLRLGTPLVSVRRTGGGYRLELARGATLDVAAVLLAVPAPAAADALVDLDPELAASMAAIDYASCATVNLAWRRRAVGRPPRSSGFFVPREVGSELVAASFVDAKFPERVPAEWTVVRLFLGGARWPRAADRPDDALTEIGVRVLAPLLETREPPAWSRVFRHPRAMPQLGVGHPRRVAALRALAASHPGLELAGGPVGAYGLPDTIAAAVQAAARLYGWLTREDASEDVRRGVVELVEAGRRRHQAVGQGEPAPSQPRET